MATDARLTRNELERFLDGVDEARGCLDACLQEVVVNVVVDVSQRLPAGNDRLALRRHALTATGRSRNPAGGARTLGDLLAQRLEARRVGQLAAP